MRTLFLREVLCGFSLVVFLSILGCRSSGKIEGEKESTEGAGVSGVAEATKTGDDKLQKYFTHIDADASQEFPMDLSNFSFQSDAEVQTDNITILSVTPNMDGSEKVSDSVARFPKGFSAVLKLEDPTRCGEFIFLPFQMLVCPGSLEIIFVLRKVQAKIDALQGKIQQMRVDHHHQLSNLSNDEMRVKRAEQEAELQPLEAELRKLEAEMLIVVKIGLQRLELKIAGEEVPETPEPATPPQCSVTLLQLFIQNRQEEINVLQGKIHQMMYDHRYLLSEIQPLEARVQVLEAEILALEAEMRAALLGVAGEEVPETPAPVTPPQCSVTLLQEKINALQGKIYQMRFDHYYQGFDHPLPRDEQRVKDAALEAEIQPLEAELQELEAKLRTLQQLDPESKERAGAIGPLRCVVETLACKILEEVGSKTQQAVLAWQRATSSYHSSLVASYFDLNSVAKLQALLGGGSSYVSGATPTSSPRGDGTGSTAVLTYGGCSCSTPLDFSSHNPPFKVCLNAAPNDKKWDGKAHQDTVSWLLYEQYNGAETLFYNGSTNTVSVLKCCIKDEQTWRQENGQPTQYWINLVNGTSDPHFPYTPAAQYQMGNDSDHVFAFPGETGSPDGVLTAPAGSHVSGLSAGTWYDFVTAHPINPSSCSSP